MHSIHGGQTRSHSEGHNHQYLRIWFARAQKWNKMMKKKTRISCFLLTFSHYFVFDAPSYTFVFVFACCLLHSQFSRGSEFHTSSTKPGDRAQTYFPLSVFIFIFAPSRLVRYAFIWNVIIFPFSLSLSLAFFGITCTRFSITKYAVYCNTTKNSVFCSTVYSRFSVKWTFPWNGSLMHLKLLGFRRRMHRLPL